MWDFKELPFAPCRIKSQGIILLSLLLCFQLKPFSLAALLKQLPCSNSSHIAPRRGCVPEPGKSFFLESKLHRGVLQSEKHRKNTFKHLIDTTLEGRYLLLCHLQSAYCSYTHKTWQIVVQQVNPFDRKPVTTYQIDLATSGTSTWLCLLQLLSKTAQPMALPSLTRLS